MFQALLHTFPELQMVDVTTMVHEKYFNGFLMDGVKMILITFYKAKIIILTSKHLFLA